MSSTFSKINDSDGQIHEYFTIFCVCKRAFWQLGIMWMLDSFAKWRDIAYITELDELETSRDGPRPYLTAFTAK